MTKSHTDGVINVYGCALVKFKYQLIRRDTVKYL